MRFDRRLLPAAAGLLALVAGSLAGWNEALTGLLVAPPFPIRLLLGSAAALLGGWLVLAAAERLAASNEPADLVRAVRLVFLAVGAFAAAVGWALGSPLPIVAGLIIAGVDVLETSLLLLVTAMRGDRRA